MAFYRDRVVPFDEDHMFDPNVPMRGNEDEYQKRMRDVGYSAIAMHDSWVFHFKGVAIGDSPVMVGKPPRLEIPDAEEGAQEAVEAGEEEGPYGEKAGSVRLRDPGENRKEEEEQKEEEKVN